MNIHSDLIDLLMEPGSPVRDCIISDQIFEQGWWFASFGLAAGFATLAKLGEPITFGDANALPRGMRIGYGKSPEESYAKAQQLAWGIQG